MADSVFQRLREDFSRALRFHTNRNEPRWKRILRLPFHQGMQAVIVHRFGEWAEEVRIPVLRHAVLGLYVLAKFFIHITAGVVIAHQAKFGKGVVIHTVHGVHVGCPRIGDYCYLQHGVAISYAVKQIGDNCYFGPGAKVFGHIRIGNNVMVGANAVVDMDVPDNCYVLAPPSRIVPKAAAAAGDGANDGRSGQEAAEAEASLAGAPQRGGGAA
ncbi:MAG TPA: DapH/DapD/GlmU-related protein [Candidatus Methylomirabilis sp.]|jgi:serine O-acetyltransferase